MKSNTDIAILPPETISEIQFNDIFDLDEIQHLQDLFSDATGVASIITRPDGTPITNSTNFCKFCNIIRKTEIGLTNCFKSDAAIGKHNSSGPIIKPCLSGGLWDAGTSITVGGKHIANWLIGQIRNEGVDDLRIIQYANEIGANKEEFIEALNEVPVMSAAQFNKVSKMLFAFANELSEKAYNNVQLKMQIAERKQAEHLLKEKNEKYHQLNKELIQTNKELNRAIENAEKSELKLRYKNEELEEKNSFIQTILDNLPIGLALNKSDEGQAIYMNKKFEEIYGWSFKELTSIESFFEKIYPDEEYRRQVTERIMTDINSGDPEKMHWENIFVTRKDGSKRIINAVNISLAKQNTMVSTVMDITILHQIQNDLVKAMEHAQESDNLKTAFLNNISHEIRTPFNGILGFLSLIQESDLTESERTEYIGIINKSAFRLMNTINDIVEISQIQAGQIKQSISETNIRKLTSGVFKHFKTDIESKGLKFFLKNELPINLDNIYTDSSKLNTILTILMANAVKFTQTGSIEFGIKLKTNDAVGENCKDKACLVPTLEFSIKDTGIGIAKNKQETIFERFMQADVSSTRQFDGSGLGLSIAKAYVEMLEGNISVESEEGRGAHFYFTIPDKRIIEEKVMLKNAVSDEAAVNHNDPKVFGLKILIVEDDEESALLLELAVRLFGKEIVRVRTGVEAIEVCRNNPDIDLILMDIKMPDINGYETTMQIRKFNTNMVIIAQTAYALTGDREKAIEAGCDDYISKPINKDQLLVLVQKYFNK